MKLHCGVSEANVSSLCCTSAESLVHSIHLCTDVYRGTQCLNRVSKWKPISQCKGTQIEEKGTSLPRSSRNTALPSEVTHIHDIKTWKPVMFFWLWAHTRRPQILLVYNHSCRQIPTTESQEDWCQECEIARNNCSDVNLMFGSKSLQPKFSKTFYSSPGRIAKDVTVTNYGSMIVDLFPKVCKGGDSTWEFHQKSVDVFQHFTVQLFKIGEFFSNISKQCN